MLMPKRVKRRRVHRGRLTGQANKGNNICSQSLERYRTFVIVFGICDFRAVKTSRYHSFDTLNSCLHSLGNTAFHSSSESYALFKLRCDIFSYKLSVRIRSLNLSKMGQKVSPHGLRVGVIKDWNAQWYADKKNFSKNLIEDHKIRTYLKKQYYQCSISKITISRILSSANDML